MAPQPVRTTAFRPHAALSLENHIRAQFGSLESSDWKIYILDENTLHPLLEIPVHSLLAMRSKTLHDHPREPQSDGKEHLRIQLPGTLAHEIFQALQYLYGFPLPEPRLIGDAVRLVDAGDYLGIDDVVYFGSGAVKQLLKLSTLGELVTHPSLVSWWKDAGSTRLAKSAESLSFIACSFILEVLSGLREFVLDDRAPALKDGARFPTNGRPSTHNPALESITFGEVGQDDSPGRSDAKAVLSSILISVPTGALNQLFGGLGLERYPDLDAERILHDIVRVREARRKQALRIHRLQTPPLPLDPTLTSEEYVSQEKYDSEGHPGDRVMTRPMNPSPRS